MGNIINSTTESSDKKEFLRMRESNDITQIKELKANRKNDWISNSLKGIRNSCIGGVLSNKLIVMVTTASIILEKDADPSITKPMI